MYYIHMNKPNIEPLFKTQPPGGGRPTRYRDTLGAEILECIKEGHDTDAIIMALQSDYEELRRFSQKSHEMERAFKALNEPPDLEDLKDDQLTYDELLERYETRAIMALYRVIQAGTSDSAKVQAAKELLDRKRGKPVQTTQVNQNVSYTIVSAIPAPPNVKGHALRDITADCEAITD